MAVDNDVVPDRSGGPAMVRAGFGARIVAETIDEDIWAGRQGLSDELMAILACITISLERQHIVIHDEGIAPPAGHDGNRIEALAIGDGDKLRPAVESNAGIAEILRNKVTRPAVLDVVELNENP